MEFQKDNTFFTGRLKSLVFALKGAIKLITTEHSIMVQSTLAVLITIAGFYFNITHEEWLFQMIYDHQQIQAAKTGLILKNSSDQLLKALILLYLI